MGPQIVLELSMDASSSPSPPRDAAGWLIWGWAVGGVLLILGQAVVRLSMPAAAALDGALTPWHWGFVAAWSGFMLYTGAWRGFHRQFNPRVVVRAMGIAEARSPWMVALAPIVAMGLLHGTRKRLLVSRGLLVGIVLLVVFVRMLPPPWRGLVDAGVSLGLLVGAIGLLGFAAAAVTGRPPAVPADFPE